NLEDNDISEADSQVQVVWGRRSLDELMAEQPPCAFPVPWEVGYHLTEIAFRVDIVKAVLGEVKRDCSVMDDHSGQSDCRQRIWHHTGYRRERQLAAGQPHSPEPCSR